VLRQRHERAFARPLWKDLITAISPSDLIEEILDDLAMGEIGQQAESFALSRIDAGTVLLDYGSLGKFRLTVTTEPQARSSAMVASI
jgi:hypothetical protein